MLVDMGAELCENVRKVTSKTISVDLEVIWHEVPKETKTMLHDEFALDCSGGQSKTLQDSFIPISVCAFQVFQELGSLMYEPTQVPPICQVAFKLAKMVPHLAYLQRQERR